MKRARSDLLAEPAAFVYIAPVHIIVYCILYLDLGMGMGLHLYLYLWAYECIWPPYTRRRLLNFQRLAGKRLLW